MEINSENFLQFQMMQYVVLDWIKNNSYLKPFTTIGIFLHFPKHCLQVNGNEIFFLLNYRVNFVKFLFFKYLVINVLGGWKPCRSLFRQLVKHQVYFYVMCILLPESFILNRIFFLIKQWWIIYLHVGNLESWT